jgi:hypothetical protein
MFRSLEEIDTLYNDHIESLKSWGQPFDYDGLVAQWEEARANFVEGRVHPWTIVPDKVRVA